MKLQFRHQPFQADAAKAVCDVFAGQPHRTVFRDSGFAGSPEKINVFEIFKLLAPNTTVRVI